MKLIKARIQGYRSIVDTGYFGIEELKTILVGPNEAGKTAILQALQKLNPPEGTPLFNPLRDYPRSKYAADILCNGINQADFTVVEGQFVLSDDEKQSVPEGYKNLIFICKRNLKNEQIFEIENVPSLLYSIIENDLRRLSTHINGKVQSSTVTSQKPDIEINEIVKDYCSTSIVSAITAKKIQSWLDKYLVSISEDSTEKQLYEKIKQQLLVTLEQYSVLEQCKKMLPTFILFTNYFRVKPSIHLEHLLERMENNNLDDEYFDYGNLCLLKLLGFTVKELSDAGKATVSNKNAESLQKYKEALDQRKYQLNAASIQLTQAIQKVWNPDPKKPEANKLRIEVDGQYLKVVVEDSLGVEVELDQRSEGFQWLVSFFIVFFSESKDKHKNAILLLDEPGLSLHGLKQAEFRSTLSKLSENNQTIFTTHSPFLVGANELDLVRVVEMVNREEGTLVHTSVTASDSAALLPLQEALGYNLAQSLFFHQKNFVLEGLTDYWYLEAISELAQNAGEAGIEKDIALIPANSAGKVVYYATILHAQNLKVAALLDSDTEGDNAASQDRLVNALDNKCILRTKDVYNGEVDKPEIEDLFRTTLISVAKSTLEWDVEAIALKQKKRPIVDVFADVIKDDFSKYKLAKAFLRWTRDHEFETLSKDEQTMIKALIKKINGALK